MTARDLASLLSDTCLVVLAKAPVRGQCKTRLAAAVGDDAALLVYRQLLTITARVASAWPGPAAVLHAGDPTAFAPGWRSTGQWLPQPPGPLGDRIAAALRVGLDRASIALVIGTDCPALSAEALAAVAAAAAEVGAAFGPATDGGFWAVASTTPAVADLLTAATIPWSAANTLEVAEQRLVAAGLRCGRGPVLADIDTREDLEAAIAAGHFPAAAGSDESPRIGGEGAAYPFPFPSTDLPRSRS